jgi:hypothetical protein
LACVTPIGLIVCRAETMANPYRAFRQLERQIFRGVPEQPEPIWQRDLNAHVPERLTGRSQLVDGLRGSAATDGATLIGTIVYRPRAEEILYEPHSPAAGAGLEEKV